MEKSENSVRIAGNVTSCRLVKSDDRNNYYGMSVVTILSDNGDSSKARSGVKSAVRCIVRKGGETDRRLGALVKELQTERSAGDPALSILHPVDIDGFLVMDGNKSVVGVAESGLSFPDKVKGNDICHVNLSGTVTSLNHDDNNASVTISTKVGENPVEVMSAWTKKSSQSCQKAWNAVSNGTLRKGDEIRLSGNLSNFVGIGKNGPETFLVIVPNEIRKRKMQLQKTSGPKI